MLRTALILTLLLVAGCAHTDHKNTGLTPEQADIRLELAERYLLDSEPRMALEQLRIVQATHPRNPRLHFNLGLTYTVLEDFENAARAYQQAVALEPSYGEAWNNLGQIKQALGDFESARLAYQRALELEEYMTPEFAAFNMASLFAEQGRIDQALAYSALGIEKNRRYIPLYEQSASLLTRTGRHQQAIDVLEKGVASRPDSLNLQLLLAEELLRVGREQEAKKMFERILRQDPEADEGRTAAYYLEALR